jgi:hypothetical protein
MQPNNPKPCQPITTVKYDMFVGCKWGFYPGVGPILLSRSRNISTSEFRRGFLKARPWIFRQYSRQASEVLQGGSVCSGLLFGIATLLP